MNDVLSGVNSTLSTVNSVLNIPTATSSSSNSSAVYIEPQARESAVSAANKASANSDVRKMFNEAKPAIEEMIATSACTTNSSPLNKYTDPDSISLPAPLNISYEIRYHKSGCLNVLRINNFKRKTSNAFNFTVYYISPQSDESVNYEYTAIKQPDGEWLFKW